MHTINGRIGIGAMCCMLLAAQAQAQEYIGEAPPTEAQFMAATRQCEGCFIPVRVLGIRKLSETEYQYFYKTESVGAILSWHAYRMQNNRWVIEGRRPGQYISVEK